MRLAVIACFLNEAAYLPTFLTSLEFQQRAPDRLLLVDDGSSDSSLRLAEEFARDRPHVRVLSRPRRPPARDRLAAAAELQAFCWGVEQLDIAWELVAKLDSDLRLSPQTFAELERRFEENPRLGVAGADLSVITASGHEVRERGHRQHVRGPTKFYRRECFEQVFPLPFRLGWDTSDEVQARMHGWQTESFAMPDGDPIHLRPTGSRDGALRKHRRDGLTTYAYGAGPLWVIAGATRRLGSRPRVLGAVHFLFGWLIAMLRSQPRADADQRAFLAVEHRRRLRRALAPRAPR
jgi:glycosyltransferase involved in cell wall biosynthesis